VQLLNVECGQAKEIAALIAVDDDACSIISGEEREFFRTHIENCSDCANFFNELKNDLHNIITDLKNLPQPDLPANFHEEFMAKLKAELKPIKRMNPIYKRFGTVAATLTALVVVSVAIISFSGGLTRNPFFQEYGIASADGIDRNGGFYNVENRRGYAGGANIESADAELPPQAMLTPAGAEALLEHDFSHDLPIEMAAPSMFGIPASAEDKQIDVVVDVYDLVAAIDAVRHMGNIVIYEYSAILSIQTMRDDFGVVNAALALLGVTNNELQISEDGEVNILLRSNN